MFVMLLPKETSIHSQLFDSKTPVIQTNSVYMYILKFTWAFYMYMIDFTLAQFYMHAMFTMLLTYTW